MTKSTTLMLAVLAMLSLGAGTAMAQDGGGGGMDYWSRQNMKAIQSGATTATGAGIPTQYGSSDVERNTGADHSATYILDHHLYGAGGVAG
jgi:hypothetical protein